MSSIHKSKHDIEKIDSQYDSMMTGKKGQIKKSTSFAKLKNAIKQNLENPQFVNPKTILSDMGSEQSDGFSDEVPQQKNGPEPDLKNIDQLSSVNKSLDTSQKNENTKTSYYVRDKFQPLKSH